MSFRARGAVCVIVLTYTSPLKDVDAHMAAHVAWLEQGLEQGVFLLAGRQEPRTGGVILCRGERAAVEAMVATDPFVIEGVAQAEVIRFNASFAQPAIAALLA